MCEITLTLPKIGAVEWAAQVKVQVPQAVPPLLPLNK